MRRRWSGGGRSGLSTPWASLSAYHGWMAITVAIDGSSLGNPGPAGWAWVVSDDVWAAGGWRSATNNIGELTAFARILEDSEEAGFGDEKLIILADSQYVINSVTKWMPGWKKKGWRKADGKPVANVDLMKRIDSAMEGRDFEITWVRGHAGHDLNEAADLRARGAADAYRAGKPVPSGPGFTNMIGSRTAWDKPRAGSAHASGRRPAVSTANVGTASSADSAAAKQAEPIVAIRADRAPSRWREVLDAARVDPVTITEPGRPSLLLLDADLAWRALAALDEDESGMGEGLLF